LRKSFSRIKVTVETAIVLGGIVDIGSSHREYGIRHRAVSEISDVTWRSADVSQDWTNGKHQTWGMYVVCCVGMLVFSVYL